MKNKKLKIPNKINICGVDYKIIKTKEFTDNFNDYWGFHDGQNSKISILTEYKGTKMHECVILETLLHEIFHAIDYINSDGKTTEHITEKLTCIFFHFFSDNNIFIGEKILSNKLYIYGLPYRVVKDYEFNENNAHGLNIAITNDELKVYCYKTDNYDMLKKNLLAVIFNKFVNGKFFTDEERSLIHNNSICSGLYQVLKETKLDKMIYEWCN